MPSVTPKNYTQSTNYSQYMKKIGWEIANLKDNSFVYIKKINFLNRSIIKIPRTAIEMKLPDLTNGISSPLTLSEQNPPKQKILRFHPQSDDQGILQRRINYKEIDKLAKSHSALLVKIEPDEKNSEQFNRYTQELTKHGFYLDKFPILQTKTVLVDLTLNETQLLKSLRSETRHHLRKSWQQDFQVEITNNDESPKSQIAFENFYALFEKCARERKFYSPFKDQMKALWDSFQNKATIILVYEKNNSNPLSGTLLLTYGNTTYYKYGASIPYGRDKFSSYFLYWEMFMWAKKQGFKNFDLEGIYDERYHRTQKYVGFTQFKKGWSKNEVTYLGSFTKYYFLPFKLLTKIGILV